MMLIAVVPSLMKHITSVNNDINCGGVTLLPSIKFMNSFFLEEMVGKLFLIYLLLE
jgi:hypothetical protein